MSLFCLSHNLIYLLYVCPSQDRSYNISKLNKQGCGLAINGHGNEVNYFAAFQCGHTMKQSNEFTMLAMISLCVIAAFLNQHHSRSKIVEIYTVVHIKSKFIFTHLSLLPLLDEFSSLTWHFLITSF